MKSTKKISKAFISFLVISTLIWLLITLSKEYTTNVSVEISFENLSKDKLLLSESPKNIDVSVTGSGFKLLAAKLKDNVVDLNPENLVRKSTTIYYFLLNNQKPYLQKQLSSGLELNQILKDTIFLSLEDLLSKKVPVILNENIQYHVGYELSEPIQLIPDSISVTGPATKLEGIQNIQLVEVALQDVTSNFELNTLIVKPRGAEKLIFDEESVKVLGRVEKFTEGSYAIPFIIENLPDNLSITTIPRKVKVIYKVGLPNFNKINENSFKVTCDYRLAVKTNSSYLVPKITSSSNLVKSIRVVPDKIDFLIQK